MVLKGKNITVGITGSIAAYKGCELIRYLQKKGATVRATLTPSAEKFIGRLTLQALTQHTVPVSWEEGETGLEHIFWARWSDTVVVAPATANTLAKLSQGFADNFLSSMVLAFDKKTVVAPAMNTVMYKNPATQENLKKLKDRGFLVVEPAEGRLACDEEGEGKLADIQDIYTEVLKAVLPDYLKGKNILITAGGTREYFDPIRYISNASSGQMGYSLAQMSYALGGNVVLVSAPTCLTAPSQIKKVDVVSAEDMYKAVMGYLDWADVVIMNSAVADFKPAQYSGQKLKKDKQSLTVQLAPNPDILKAIGERKREGQIVIGFAAESENIIQNAEDKLKRKNLDYIVANSLSVFSKDTHSGWIVSKDGQIYEIPPMDKENSALYILEKIFKR
ncbi:MAG: bifunctional phosphopantothenoylcysteine decarboxylase/phosphopantothenate--cysteine ligase CoaBC [Aquificae bacterium]|nr:bifunctional phosphopantothenoylcysteine decarboxylase/phosphopantothenate--cysteine ligase CoaBC [Aquificota bacterium]